MSDLREHAEWLLVNGDEDIGYWQEQARIDDWIAAGKDEAAKPPRPPDAGSSEPVLAVSLPEAGRRCGGKSTKWIEKHVLPYVETLRPSRSVLIVAASLERWVAENSGKGLL
jgi:hypothetical protein